MAHWLLKTEPSSYSWDDLVHDKKTPWNGVTNATALQHLRKMKKDDLALIYHTADQRQAVGVARIASDPYPDPDAENPRFVIVDIKPVRKLPQPVSLEVFKADPVFAGWDLLRISRLSIVPVPDKMWKRIEELAGLK